MLLRLREGSSPTAAPGRPSPSGTRLRRSTAMLRQSACAPDSPRSGRGGHNRARAARPLPAHPRSTATRDRCAARALLDGRDQVGEVLLSPQQRHAQLVGCGRVQAVENKSAAAPRCRRASAAACRIRRCSSRAAGSRSDALLRARRAPPRDPARAATARRDRRRPWPFRRPRARSAKLRARLPPGGSGRARPGARPCTGEAIARLVVRDYLFGSPARRPLSARDRPRRRHERSDQCLAHVCRVVGASTVAGKRSSSSRQVCRPRTVAGIDLNARHRRAWALPTDGQATASPQPGDRLRSLQLAGLQHAWCARTPGCARRLARSARVRQISSATSIAPRRALATPLRNARRARSSGASCRSSSCARTVRGEIRISGLDGVAAASKPSRSRRPRIGREYLAERASSRAVPAIVPLPLRRRAERHFRITSNSKNLPPRARPRRRRSGP